MIQENEEFKRTVHLELDQLKTLLASSNQAVLPKSEPSPILSSGSPAVSLVVSSPSMPSTSTNQVLSSGVLTNSSSSNPNSNSIMSSSVDSQVMLMLAESFYKLSIVLVVDKGTDSKVEWPKFSGDSKLFKAWYLAIVAQLSIPPWKELYNESTRDIVKITSNAALNQKLYAKLLTCLEGTALQSIVARSHLHSDGLQVLQDLTATHRPLHVPEIIAAKTVQFWGSTRRMSTKTVDVYYNRFKELLDEIQDADGPIPTKNVMRHFIFTLGSEFEPIQHNYRMDNLPSKWRTENWPELLVLCRYFFLSVKPNGFQKKDNYSTNGNSDRLTHQKKVREWFLHPAKFCREITAAQKCDPDKCIYHLSTSHATADCHIKKECDKMIAEQKSKMGSQNGSSTSAFSVGHLRNIKEEDFEDACAEITSDVAPESNDTNQDVLDYFARMTNHYL